MTFAPDAKPTPGGHVPSLAASLMISQNGKPKPRQSRQYLYFIHLHPIFRLPSFQGRPISLSVPQCGGFEWAAAFLVWLWAAIDIGHLHMAASEREVERIPSQKGAAEEYTIGGFCCLKPVETSERMETLLLSPSCAKMCQGRKGVNLMLYSEICEIYQERFKLFPKTTQSSVPDANCCTARAAWSNVSSTRSPPSVGLTLARWKGWCGYSGIPAPFLTANCQWQWWDMGICNLRSLQVCSYGSKNISLGPNVLIICSVMPLGHWSLGIWHILIYMIAAMVKDVLIWPASVQEDPASMQAVQYPSEPSPQQHPASHWKCCDLKWLYDRSHFCCYLITGVETPFPFSNVSTIFHLIFWCDPLGPASKEKSGGAIADGRANSRLACPVARSIRKPRTAAKSAIKGRGSALRPKTKPKASWGKMWPAWHSRGWWYYKYIYTVYIYNYI